MFLEKVDDVSRGFNGLFRIPGQQVNCQLDAVLVTIIDDSYQVMLGISVHFLDVLRAVYRKRDQVGIRCAEQAK